jgi:ankyrin repeat protein
MNVVNHRQLAVSVALIAGFAIAAAAFAPPVMAQQVAPAMKSARKPSAPPSSAPPSALPGAQLGADRVVPSDKSAADMSPTDALFDAVTRGDISAAQDAINRGADFNARNVLGLTPLDESIDLGRNNITFLLLSLRGASDVSAAQSAPAKSVGSQPLAPSGPLASPTARSIEPTRTASDATADMSASAILTQGSAGGSAGKTAAAGSQTAQQPTASNAAPETGKAGTPNPKSGFNGFGG